MRFRYIRDGRTPIACVCLTDDGQVGVSICSPKDAFNKARAREIAAGRAMAIAAGRNVCDDDDDDEPVYPNRWVRVGEADSGEPIQIHFTDALRETVRRMQERRAVR